jgi:adenylate cyclase
MKQWAAYFHVFRSWLDRTLRREQVKYHQSIGAILVQRGIITEPQLEKALAVQREKFDRTGKAVRLGQIIVELGYASESALVEAINLDYQLQVTSLTDDIRGQVADRRRMIVEAMPAARIPIWLQLFGATLLIILISIGSLSFFTIREQRQRLYQQTVKIGKVSLNYFSSNARIPMLEDDILALNTLINEATRVQGLLYAIIVDTQQVIKAHTDVDRIDTPFKGFSNLGDETREGLVRYFDYLSENGRHILNLTRTVVFKEKVLGEVHVGISIDFIETLVRKERGYILLISMFVIILGSVIAVWLGFRFSEPISQLVLATRAIGEGNYQHKIVLDRNDELGNLATAFNQMGEELLRNTMMQQSFGKYIGREVLDMIMAHPESGWLKGHKNEATVVFIDIRGFTAFAEVNPPEQIVEALNTYFEIATRVINQYGGYVDKFIGDAILGVFGVPVFHPDHAERAVRAVLEMHREFRSMPHETHPLLQSVGISINTGLVIAGNIGSQDRLEYTVIGDSVNVASRLNSLAGAGETVISQSVLDQVPDLLTVEKLVTQMIRGRSESVTVFKVTGWRKTDVLAAAH